MPSASTSPNSLRRIQTYAVDRLQSPKAQLLAALGTTAALFIVAFGIESITSSEGVIDFRPALLCVSLLGFSIVSYVVWPSRWNILAHTQLAFGIVAYIIPILFLGGGRLPATDVLALYTTIMAIGLACAVGGSILGGWLATRKRNEGFVDAITIPTATLTRPLPHRVAFVAFLAIVGVIIAFLVMGFIPALAADPYAAKFFRGIYAESYAPVAPLYRASTSALTVLLPLLTMFAAWRRKPVWIVLFIATVGILLLTLQREPAVSGILLFIGAVIALRTRGMLLYFVGIVAVYFAGSASYFVFAALGIGNFSAGVGTNPLGFLESVAAGAPDVADQFVFLGAWLSNPVYANGLTFVGGLIPGNFQWNPSVWSLAVTNPGADVTTINSGGFRLPGPLWGYVNLGWFGVVLVGTVYGVLVGYLARSVQRVLTLQAARIVRGDKSRERVVITFIVYAAIADCATQFFALSYVSVIQTGLVLAIVYLGIKLPWRRKRNSSAIAEVL